MMNASRYSLQLETHLLALYQSSNQSTNQSIQSLVTNLFNLIQPLKYTSFNMSTNPAIAGTILRNFGIITAAALTGVYASDRIISIASRKEMSLRGEQGVYNASVHPEQDPLYVFIFPVQERTIALHCNKKKSRGSDF